MKTTKSNAKTGILLSFQSLVAHIIAVLMIILLQDADLSPGIFKKWFSKLFDFISRSVSFLLDGKEWFCSSQFCAEKSV